MNTQNFIQTIDSQNKTNLILITLISFLLSACGTSKSNTTTETNLTTFSSSAQKPLANCSKSANSNMSVSLAAAFDQSGQLDPNWVKLKFNFLSTQATAAGNTIRLFKWKVSGTQSYLEPTALVSVLYNLGNGQQVSQNLNSIPVSQITTQVGLQVLLSDANSEYQVLKIAIYNSTGQIVLQSDNLIPQFSAKPSDYATNSDGRPRAQILQDLHPLKSTNTTGWSENAFKQHFEGLCF